MPDSARGVEIGGGGGNLTFRPSKGREVTVYEELKYFVPDTPDQGLAGSDCEEEGENLYSLWRLTARRRSVVNGLPHTGRRLEAALGMEDFVDPLDDFENTKTEDLLQDENLVKCLHLEACNMVLACPAVRDMIECQMKALAGDPGVVKNLADKNRREELTRPSVPDKGQTSNSVNPEGSPVKFDGKKEEEPTEEQVRKVLEHLKNKNGHSTEEQERWPRTSITKEGSDLNPLRRQSSEKVEQERSTMSGLPCPEITRPHAAGSTFHPSPSMNPAWPLRMPSKELVKIGEFSGGRGFPCPEEAEQWMHALARAVKFNSWSAEDALGHAIGKLTGTAATWYQNHEHMFDKHPSGPEAGWRSFWCMFEKTFVGRDEQALWNQFESRVQQADESVEVYADAIRRMAGRLNVSIDGGSVRSTFLKGLASSLVRARIEGTTHLLANTFDAWEEAASHHELAGRRDGKQKSATSTVHAVTMHAVQETDKKKGSYGVGMTPQLSRRCWKKVL